MPAQPECDFFIRSASQLETDGSRDAIRMRDNTENIDAHVVGGIRAGPNACPAHDPGDMIVPKESGPLAG